MFILCLIHVSVYLRLKSLVDTIESIKLIMNDLSDHFFLLAWQPNHK